MRLIADIYDRPSVDFRNKADLAALASGRFAPTSGHSITTHSANLKIASRSRTINQCSGGSFPRGQYRLQLHSAGPQKHSDTQRWLV
jgi:hypothetical protein